MDTRKGQDKELLLDIYILRCFNAFVTSAVQVLRNPIDAAVVLDPIRLKLLENLTEPQSAASLSRLLDIPRQKINYHLHELERIGMVKETETRKRGNCTERLMIATATHFLVSPEAFGKLGAGPQVGEDRGSAAYLLNTAARTISDLVELRRLADAAGMRLSTMTLETEIRFRSPGDRDGFTQELTYAIAQLMAKYHDTISGEGRTFRFVIGSYPFLAAAADAALDKPSVRMD